MPTLEDSARMVALQFRISNPRILPKYVRELPEESCESQVKRRNNQTGILIIESSRNTSVAQLLADLEYFRYEMINAVSFLRTDLNDPSRKSKYHIVRYSFVLREHVRISNEFRELRVEAIADLRGICESALWNAEVYSNPFVSGEEVPASGARTISVNLAGRKPIVPVWHRDGEGNRLGESPVLMQPDYNLRLDAEAGPALIPTN
ncbi:MAG: hypothetical protein UT82_C0009G0015 [Parcubacteria group bacterium GW2011_GWB1_40_14]|nr:MAG: hypothetical protein UT82_C0009G0015 [Parcubacteria group bacterium GW2011_GWB1_40_14]